MADKDLIIGIFGRRKTGKTDLITALGGRGKPSESPGTAANIPVKLKGLGQVNLLAPAGLDDERALGIRSQEAKALLQRIDVAVVVIDASVGWSDYERFLLSKVRFSGDPVVAVINREQGDDAEELQSRLDSFGVPWVEMNLAHKPDVSDLVSALQTEAGRLSSLPSLVEKLINEGDLLWLVVPNHRPSYLDPVGPLEMRLMSDVIIAGGTITVVREADFRKQWSASESKPSLIVADPAVFAMVRSVIPDSVPLTTLSMLVARQRGELSAYVKGAQSISKLQPGDRVLIAEGCQLHVQPEDIGRVEIPNLLRKWVGGDLEFSTSGGGWKLEGLKGYRLVVRCATCMLDRPTAEENLKIATEEHVPVTNYGTAIAYMHGVLPRLVAPFVRAGEIEAPEVDEERTIPIDLHDEFSIPPCM